MRKLSEKLQISYNSFEFWRKRKRTNVSDSCTWWLTKYLHLSAERFKIKNLLIFRTHKKVLLKTPRNAWLRDGSNKIIKQKRELKILRIQFCASICQNSHNMFSNCKETFSTSELNYWLFTWGSGHRYFYVNGQIISNYLYINKQNQI